MKLDPWKRDYDDRVARAHWLIKSEPFKYSFDQLTKDGKTTWDGVRNFEARNNLRAMKAGDPCLFYHSGEGKEVVGVARVAREAYPDPTTKEDFSAVDVEPVRALPRPVSLGEMRAHPVLSGMMIFRRPRLSVVPVTVEEYELLTALADTEAPDETRRAPSPKKSAAGPNRALSARKSAAVKGAPARRNTARKGQPPARGVANKGRPPKR